MNRSYLGLIIWLIVFLVVTFTLPFLPIESEGLLTRIMLNITSLSILVLMVIIYFTEKIFWFNGVTYEEAIAAGSYRRKQYAKKMMIAFLIPFVIYLFASIILQVLNANIWIDIVLFVVITVVSALSTIKVKL